MFTCNILLLSTSTSSRVINRELKEEFDNLFYQDQFEAFSLCPFNFL